MPSLNLTLNELFTSTIKNRISPFLGYPFVKRSFLGEDKGRVSTASCPPMKDWKASEDSEMVRRFKESGLRILVELIHLS